MPPQRIVGLDLSLVATGYYVVDAGVEKGGLIAPGKLSGVRRLDHILTAVRALLVAPYETLAVVEDFSFGSKGQAVFQIAGLGYLVRHFLWQSKIPTLLVPPALLKKYVTGSGNADKTVMLKEIYKRWGADINDDNVGDAYALARIGTAHVVGATGLTAFQVDVLKKVRELNSTGDLP